MCQRQATNFTALNYTWIEAFATEQPEQIHFKLSEAKQWIIVEPLTATQMWWTLICVISVHFQTEYCSLFSYFQALLLVLSDLCKSEQKNKVVWRLRPNNNFPEYKIQYTHMCFTQYKSGLFVQNFQWRMIL